MGKIPHFPPLSPQKAMPRRAAAPPLAKIPHEGEQELFIGTTARAVAVQKGNFP